MKANETKGDVHMRELHCSSNIIYSFHQENEPKMTVNSGETIVIETYDCFENQIQSPTDTIDALDWERINPATGPIYINEAETGDILKVTIHKIEVGERGVLVTGPNVGMLGDELTEMALKMVDIRENQVIFNDELAFPLTKMIGVIGVAPEGKPVPCGTPDRHGGNMDTCLIKEGATLYLPVFVKGALFALGDFHAAMGDGEIGGSGVEVAGKATVTLEVIKGSTIEHPMLENEEHLAFIVSAATMDEAIQLATKKAVHFLVRNSTLTLAESTMLLSAVGQAQISQVVDPLLTARFLIPKSILQSLQINISS